jgi:hypothetical protein
MEDRQKPDRRAQVFGVGRDGEQGLRHSPERNAVNLFGVLQRETADPFGQCEHDVEILDRQQLGLSLRQPPGTRYGLAFWAMPIPTGVVGDGCVSAVIAAIHMTTESGRAAVSDGPKCPFLMTTEHRSPASEEIAFESAEDLGHFQPMFAHEHREAIRAG